MNIANRGADLRVAIRPEILHQKIDETAVTLKERKHLHGAIVILRKNPHRWWGCKRLQLSRHATLKENREKRREAEPQSRPHAIHYTLQPLIVSRQERPAVS